MNTATTAVTDSTATAAATVAEILATTPVDLGGVTVTAVVPDKGTSAAKTVTPGSAAKRRANSNPKPAKAVKVAKAPKAKVEGEKRAYTARGTTVQARRVVLTNGVAKGRGRPSDEGKGKRTVVYVPVGMKYDSAVHGAGVKFNVATHAAPHRRLAVAKLGYALPAKLAKAVEKAAGKAKSKPATKAKSKTVAIAKVSAPVEAPVTAPAPVVAETVAA